MDKYPGIANTHKFYEMTREEMSHHQMSRLNSMAKVDRGLYIAFLGSCEFNFFYIHQGQPANGLHLAMFVNSIMNLSNEEQLKKWGPLALNFQIHGCYAQTEIGHGSNVAGLETTAVFDIKTDEFIVDTPV
jgi:acyl-CoA oxidase